MATSSRLFQRPSNKIIFTWRKAEKNFNYVSISDKIVHAAPDSLEELSLLSSLKLCPAQDLKIPQEDTPLWPLDLARDRNRL
jgi:hypothetical protein